MEVSKISGRDRSIAICALTFILVLGVLSAVRHNSFVPSLAGVTAASPSPTAVVSIVPENISDLLKGPMSIVVFNVTLSTSPSISSFAVWLQFDPQVLHAADNAIDYSGNVLGSLAQVRSECINGAVVKGAPCQPYPLSDSGIVSLELVNFGNMTTSFPTAGLLFRLTLTVVQAESFSRIHFLQVVLAIGGGSSGKGELYSSTTVDGFFSNKHCGSVTCKPPSVDFTFSPSQPSVGSTVTFNGSASKTTNANARILSYHWYWNDQNCLGGFSDQIIPDPIITHTFCVAQFFPVTLIVIDSFGIAWSITKHIQIVYVFVDVTVGGVDLDNEFNVYPGTVVHIKADIRNNSTLPLTANLTITLDTGRLLGNKTFNLSERGGSGTTTGTLGPVSWDTSGYLPRVYRINVKVASDAHQNVTSDKSTSTFVQLIVRPPGGSFSLGLFQTTGLGLIVLIGALAGLARLRKKPSWETEPLEAAK